jgi:hypothetical protein
VATGLVCNSAASTPCSIPACEHTNGLVLNPGACTCGSNSILCSGNYRYCWGLFNRCLKPRNPNQPSHLWKSTRCADVTGGSYADRETTPAGVTTDFACACGAAPSSAPRQIDATNNDCQGSTKVTWTFTLSNPVGATIQAGVAVSQGPKQGTLRVAVTNTKVVTLSVLSAATQLPFNINQNIVIATGGTGTTIPHANLISVNLVSNDYCHASSTLPGKCLSYPLCGAQDRLSFPNPHSPLPNIGECLCGPQIAACEMTAGGFSGSRKCFCNGGNPYCNAAAVDAFGTALPACFANPRCPIIDGSAENGFDCDCGAQVFKNSQVTPGQSSAGKDLTWTINLNPTLSAIQAQFASVTQNSNAGQLLFALTGTSVSSITVLSAASQVFDTSANIVIDDSFVQTTIPQSSLAQVESLSNWARDNSDSCGGTLGRACVEASKTCGYGPCANQDGSVINEMHCKCEQQTCQKGGQYCRSSGIGVPSRWTFTLNTPVTANVAIGAVVTQGAGISGTLGVQLDNTPTSTVTVLSTDQFDTTTANLLINPGLTSTVIPMSSMTSVVNALNGLCSPHPVCNILDGSAENKDTGGAACMCGTAICTEDTGFVCKAAENACSRPLCAETTGAAANSGSCVCGTAVCDSATGFWCDSSTNTCSLNEGYVGVYSGQCTDAGYKPIADPTKCHDARTLITG